MKLCDAEKLFAICFWEELIASIVSDAPEVEDAKTVRVLNKMFYH